MCAGLVNVQFPECTFIVDTANNWGICISWRVSVRPLGAGLGMNIFWKIHLYWTYTANNWEIVLIFGTFSKFLQKLIIRMYE